MYYSTYDLLLTGQIILRTKVLTHSSFSQIRLSRICFLGFGKLAFFPKDSQARVSFLSSIRVWNAFMSSFSMLVPCVPTCDRLRLTGVIMLF